MERRAAIVCCSAVVWLSFTSFGCTKKRHVARTAPARTPIPTAVGIKTSELGLASWYGHPYHGRAAADGEIYDMEKMTAAHRTLPFNTWVRVTNVANTKAVEVRITDRGPFVEGRIIDLSHAAASAIDLVGPGVGQVRVDVIEAPVTADALAGFAVQIGAFQDRSRAERLRTAFEQQYGRARIVLRDGQPQLWRVLVGSERTLDSATLLAQQIRSGSTPALVVRLDQ